MMIHGQNAKARGKMKIYGIFSNVCRYKGSITKLMGFRIPHIINSAHINEF